MMAIFVAGYDSAGVGVVVVVVVAVVVVRIVVCIFTMGERFVLSS